MLVLEPTLSVTVMKPSVASAGTFTSTSVALDERCRIGAEPPIVTWSPLTNPVPWILTSAPRIPLSGVNEFTFGPVAAVNAAVAAGGTRFETVTLPDVTPVGTVAVMCVLSTTVGLTAGLPLNFTLPPPARVTPRKLLPLIVIVWPGSSSVESDRLLIDGAASAVNVCEECAVPAGFVIVTGP